MLKRRLQLLILVLVFQSLWISLISGQDPPPTDQDVMVLINGDRIQGRLLGTREDGTLIFESPVLGKLEVSGENATIANGQLGTGGNASNRDAISLGEAIVEAESATITDTTQLNGEVEEKTPVKPRFEPLDIPLMGWIKYPEVWRGRLRFGLDYQTGERKAFNINIENSIRIPRKHDSFAFEVRYDYETQGENNRIRRDRYNGRFRYDYNISEHRFFNAETNYQVDRIRQINHEARQSVGYGLKWEKQEKYELQIVPGFTGSYTDQEGNALEFDDWTVFGRFFQAFNYKISKNYSFNQTFEGFVSPLDPDLFDLNLRFGLLGSLTAQLALELDYELDYDSRVADEIAREDSRLRANIIYRY